MSKKTSNKTKGKKLTAKQLKYEIFRLFKRHPKKRFNPKQIIKKLKVANNKDSVEHALSKLVEDSKAQELTGNKYTLPSNRDNSRQRSTHIGEVDMTKSGAAYIITEDLDHDVYIPPKFINGALHGDKVKITAYVPRGRRKMEGKIVEVVERVLDHFIGIYRESKKDEGIVIPDHINIPFDINIKKGEHKGAKDGEVVVAKIIKWPTAKHTSPLGVVTSVLGAPGGSDMEMKSILINNGFNITFPEEVLAEVKDLNGDIPEMEVHRRRDMRDIPTFTIDPTDAKDFDDALSFRYLDDGNREIGVHIADVTHFLLPGTALDKEAYLRSTSVYLVDRVCPMLPEKLSNELCSLRPNEDKYTFSAVFVFDKNDKIVNQWFGKTLIHSDRRFTYNEAQEVLDAGQGDHVEELKELNRLAHKLRKQRFKKGGISFETEEVRFRLDEDGVPVEVYVKERKDVHLLIEDFMLLANKKVAEFIHKKEGAEVPFVYRVHDLPDPAKLAEFAVFAKQLGFQVNIENPKAIANSLNRLAKEAQKNELLKMLEPIAIRTMSKAEYSPDNIGHYGLGFDFYSHFTSPIRRYSDVLAHRILRLNLEGTYRMDKEKLVEQCKHISDRERKAQGAERESIKYKQVEFMEKHVGEVFEGYISGMIDKGMFVELAGNKCEGMVPFELVDDQFELLNGRLQARGIYSGHTYKMGDKVHVQILETDLKRRSITMKLAEEA